MGKKKKPQVREPIIHVDFENRCMFAYTPYNKAWVEYCHNADATWDKEKRAWRFDHMDTSTINTCIKDVYGQNPTIQPDAPSAEQYTTPEGDKDMPICTCEGCENEATRLKENGVFTQCNTCYMRQYREQKEEATPETPKETPQATKTPQPNDMAQAITQAITGVLGQFQGSASGEMLQAIETRVQALENNRPRNLQVSIADMPKKELPMQHEAFDEVLFWLVNKENVLVVGPSGTGKTTMGHSLAQALEVPYYYTGAVLQKYELLGYNDANGQYVETDFYKAYKNGGLFLFDEVDASSASALVAFNSALDNGMCPFPCGMVERHKDFYVVASGNTYGRGADRRFVGRNPLDGAFINRFVCVTVDYDAKLEKYICNPQNEDEQAWFDKIISWRENADKHKINAMITTRNIKRFLTGLRGGRKLQELEASCIWYGLEQAQISKIKGGK